jgi:prevent-host-death family protein
MAFELASSIVPKVDYNYIGMQFNVHEAKTQFSKLLDLALQGEEVIIMRNGVPVAEVVPARKHAIPLGAGRHDTNASSHDWWKALTDEEAEAFYEGK